MNEDPQAGNGGMRIVPLCDVPDLPITVTRCAPRGPATQSAGECPLLAVSRFGCCGFHESGGRTNSFDQHARDGMTVLGLLKHMAGRRRAAANFFALRSITKGRASVDVVRGFNGRSRVVVALVLGVSGYATFAEEFPDIETEDPDRLAAVLHLAECRLFDVLRRAREWVNANRENYEAA